MSGIHQENKQKQGDIMRTYHLFYSVPIRINAQAIPESF